jgi:ATP-dependent Lon protease
MGGILLLETMLVPGGKGRLVLTGSLGDVIKESAELGLTWVKSRAVALGITSHRNQDPLKNVDIHVSGIANPVDGADSPSCTSLAEQ